jgi:hypothetical protein
VTTTPLELATVAFSGDLPLLDLQARSIGRFVPPDLVGRISYIINDPDEELCRRHIEEVTAPLLGPLRDRLAIFTGSSRGQPGQEGWIIQQACKLDIARSVDTRHFVVLDAKNFILRPISESDILFKGGLARMPFGRKRGDPQWLIDSLIFFGLDPALGEGKFPPSVPPFCMRTDIVLEMIDAIERQAGTDLFDFFARKTDKSTEFMLYIAFLMKTGRLGEVVTGRATKQPIIRRASPARGAPGDFFDKAKAPQVWTMAVHRRRFLDLDWDHPTREGLLDLWTGSGLFKTPEEAREEMARLIAFYQAMRGQAMMANRSRVSRSPESAAPADDGSL